MMLLENFTVSFATTPVLSRPQLSVLLQVASPKSTKRYSILAVKLSVNAASIPAPAVQPNLIYR
jgi:hypothetical protein